MRNEFFGFSNEYVGYLKLSIYYVLMLTSFSMCECNKRIAYVNVNFKIVCNLECLRIGKKNRCTKEKTKKRDIFLITTQHR